jgi:hypothetical protein
VVEGAALEMLYRSNPIVGSNPTSSVMITANTFSQMDAFHQISNEKQKSSYSNSIFLPLKELSSRKKGKYFENIFKEWAKGCGLLVEKAQSSNHDCIIEGKKVEIKGSFLWDGNTFKWQQIRTHQDYDILILMSIYPDRIEIHGCSKKESIENLEIKDQNGNWIYQQHGGKNKSVDTVHPVLWFSTDNPNKIGWIQTIENKEDFLSLLEKTND